jgi:hypothetical protein
MTASERDRSGRPCRPFAVEDGSAGMRSGPDQPRTTDEFALTLMAAPPEQAGLRNPTDRHGEYIRARAAEDDHAQRQRALAARTVAGNARSLPDCSLLLSILGLDPGEGNEEGSTSSRRGLNPR